MSTTVSCRRRAINRRKERIARGACAGCGNVNDDTTYHNCTACRKRHMEYYHIRVENGQRVKCYKKQDCKGG